MHKSTFSEIDNNNNRDSKLILKNVIHEIIKIRIDEFIISFCKEISYACIKLR